MTTTPNLSKIIPRWVWFKDQLKSQGKLLNFDCVWLIGTQNSGRSTLCQLFQATVGKNQNKKLNFKDDGKIKVYELPDIISNNTFSIQTVEPKLYQIKSQLQNLPNKNIVDVPTFAIQPFNDSNKKIWTPLQSKITFKFLLKMAHQSIFVLVIDQKFTRAPMDAVKATMLSFLDSFKEYPKQLLNSTAMMISKSANFKVDTFVNRIQTWAKKAGENGAALEAWIQNLKQRNAFLVFNKAASDQTTRSQAVILYEQISKLNSYHIQPNIVNSFNNFPQDQKQQLRKYLNGLASGFSQLIKIIIEVLDQIIKDEQRFLSQKKQLSLTLFGIKDEKNIPALSLPDYFAIINVCCGIANLQKSEKNDNIFMHMLENLTKNKMISEQEQIYQCLKERADFYSFFFQEGHPIADWDDQGALKTIYEEAKKIRLFKRVSQIIKDSYQQNQSNQFYYGIITAIQFLVPTQQLQNHELLNVWINCTLEMAAKMDKPQALQKFLELQMKLKQWKKMQLIGNLLAKIAELLTSLNKVAFAVSLFNKCGNPYKAIQIMSNILKSKSLKKQYQIKDFVPYLQLLQQIGLFQKSYETCYFLGNIYDTAQQISVLKQFLVKQPTGPKKDSIDSFIDKKIKGLEPNQTDQLTKIAKELSNKNI